MLVNIDMERKLQQSGEEIRELKKEVKLKVFIINELIIFLKKKIYILLNYYFLLKLGSSFTRKWSKDRYIGETYGNI